jgi:hypothetical protein
MKVWEEQWDWHPRGGGGARLYSDQYEEEWATTWGDDSNDRAKLAAAAPDMARLLIEIEWQGDEVRYRCPSCGGGTPGHESDCALDAVLRKAGVR